MQPVRQLDDDDPDILCHGQQHFADIFRLLLLPGGKRHLAQLGDAVYHQGHIFAELLFNALAGGGGILHHIVQKGGYQGFGIHAQPHQNDRHCDRMADIGLA